MAKKAKKTDDAPEPLPIPDARRMTATLLSKVFGFKSHASVKEFPRNSDGKTYDLFAVVPWRIEDAERKCVERAGGDPDLVGPDSPSLERLRAAKATLAEFDVAERDNQLIPMDEMRPALSLGAKHIRAAGERAQKAYGPEAQRIIDEALENWEAELEKYLQPKETKS